MPGASVIIILSVAVLQRLNLLVFSDRIMKLLGKKALVTGAARGIGRGCALELARAGADVAINDRERTPRAEAVVAEIEALGRRAVLVEGDVFERTSCESVVARTISALARIDIFVSNPALHAPC